MRSRPLVTGRCLYEVRERKPLNRQTKQHNVVSKCLHGTRGLYFISTLRVKSHVSPIDD